MKQKHFIDSHKGATALFTLLMMFVYSRYENTTLWIYLALHGGYGVLWILKSFIFGDRQWEQECSIFYGLYIWSGLSLYWISPYLIASRDIQAPLWYICVCVFVYILGVFLHFPSDMQKHTQLSLKKGLITDGMFTRCRNTNYLGELFIYLGFSMLPMHWAPLCALFLFICIIWIPNMLRKEKSLSRYPEFAEYKKRSFMFLPFF